MVTETSGLILLWVKHWTGNVVRQFNFRLVDEIPKLTLGTRYWNPLVARQEYLAIQLHPLDLDLNNPPQLDASGGG